MFRPSSEKRDSTININAIRSGIRSSSQSGGGTTALERRLLWQRFPQMAFTIT